MAHSLAVRAAVPDSLARVREVIEQLAARDHTGEVLTAVRHIPAREAQWAAIPEWVRPELAAAYAAKRISRLYTHQRAAADAVREGRNVVIVTPTASGKTVCYNLPVLNAVLENADTRALYLFPTKALAQDQLAELHDLGQRLNHAFGVFTYDGDTPSDARKAIREKGHIVLSNPDMLHTGILPHHTRWNRLFENLRYIRAGRAAHLSRRLWQPSLQRATASAAHRRFLWLEAAIHLQLGDHCQSRRAGEQADRRRCGSTGHKRRAGGRKNVRLLQPAGGEPVPGNPPQLHQRNFASRPGISEARSANDGFSRTAACTRKCCSRICSRRFLRRPGQRREFGATAEAICRANGARSNAVFAKGASAVLSRRTRSSWGLISDRSMRW